ncbi:hypothetical protein KAI58_00115 [Candidatus Gracilibacteria bacterium]|nr:hypothetical protein [Candidatus Gracilibacteria bacterium]
MTQTQTSGTTTTNLQALKTPSGKGIADFKISEKLIQEDQGLIELVMLSESMNDGERQYWFNLTEVMNMDQTEKLRNILVRERQKLAEIDAKYNKKKVVEDPEVVAKRVQEKARIRSEEQAQLRKREAEHEAAEKNSEEDLLGELNNL